MTHPRLSIIVLVLNSERHLERLLQSVTNLDYPDYELIFVDGGSTDLTLQILQSYPVRVVHAPGSNIAEARNHGVKKSTGALVAFTDHDCIVDHNWAKHLVHHVLSDPFVGGAGGPNYIVSDGTAKSDTIAYVLGSWLGSAGSTQFFKYESARAVPAIPACNLIFRRDILEEAGLFDENLLYCEDADICHRVTKLGRKILYVPSAVVYHHLRLDSFRKLWVYFFAWGLARTYGARKRRYLFSKTSLALLACSSVMFSVAILGLFYFPAFLVFVTSVSTYAGVLLFASVRVKRKSNGVVKLSDAILAYLVEHVAYTLGLFVGLVAKRPLAYKIHAAQYSSRDSPSKP
jgi:GT2 family glycosyltransferase